jgi:hypothetical protein
VSLPELLVRLAQLEAQAGPAALQAALAASLQCPSSMKPARSHSSQSCAEVAPATCQQADKAQAGYDVQSSQQCVEV